MPRPALLFLATLTLATSIGVGWGTRAEAQAGSRARDAADAQALFSLRLEAHEDRRQAGLSLLGEGLFSVGAGALTAGLGYEHPDLVGAGVGTVIWGAVNGLLALLLLDLDGSHRASIVRDRELRGDALEAAIREERSRQREATQIFELNTAADLLYIASGIFLYAFSQSSSQSSGAGGDGPALAGYGLAQILQGSFLFLFDMGEWVDRGQSFRRADQLLHR